MEGMEGEREEWREGERRRESGGEGERVEGREREEWRERGGEGRDDREIYYYFILFILKPNV